jgi:polar amino acid transport system substrate-binding protein
MVELIHRHYNTQRKSHAALTHEALAMETLIARHETPLGRTNPARIAQILEALEAAGVLDTAFAANDGQLVFADPFEEPVNDLTAEERAFVEALGPLRVAVESSGWPPFEAIDSQGRFRGIAADYLDILRERLGLEIEIVADLAWDEILDAMREREVDVLPSAASTPDRREYALFTQAYVRSPMILVTRDDIDFVSRMEDLIGHVVGVPEGYAADELLSRYYPGLTIRRYRNTLEGLRAVASGDAHAFVDNLVASAHLIRAHGLANLKISGQAPYSNDLSFAVRSDWPLLHTAIEKTLASIPPERQQEIYDRWVRSPQAEPFPWHIVLPAALAASFAIILLASYALRLRSLNRRLEQAEMQLQDKNRQLHDLSVTDKLTGAFNRHHLDTVLAELFERARRYRRPLALVMFDLDDFKSLNDRLGHQAGDEALRAFSNTVRRSIRSSDVFGRWGGEEFMLICPETDAAQAAHVAEKIRNGFEASAAAGGTTVSAGVADAFSAPNVDTLIRSADARLYAAKLAGRNRVVTQEPTAPEVFATPSPER